jgi:uncharacterized protein involved in oxidation of intracellular sulfur
MKILLVINDAPYGNEKAYNAMRLAIMLQREHADVEVLIFLMGDGVFCGLPFNNVPHGYYNIETMLENVISKGAKVRMCRICSQARGIFDLELIEGVERSNMSEYAQWVVEADKVINY